MPTSSEMEAIDTALYLILFIDLMRYPLESMQLIGLCRWLETTDPQIFTKIFSLPHTLINELAEEGALCLHCIVNKDFVIDDREIPLIKTLANGEISLEFFRTHRKNIINSIRTYLSDVALSSFSTLTCDTVIERNKNRSFTYLDCTDQRREENARLFGFNEDEDLFFEDRTVIVMFYKESPLTEAEVRELFAGSFGECVESVHMQEVSPGEQASYARVVFKVVDTMEMVLNGKDKVKLIINEKHVWVRRMMPKNHKLPGIVI